MQLADGDWHRLHPATPLLRGGIAFIAILGFVIANLRERLVEWFIPGLECPDELCYEDPLAEFLERNLTLALLGAVVVLVLIIAGFFLSWRMHTFRVTDEVVEVRSGILFRSHRKARLDRVQGINIARPLLARIFGAAKLEVSAAGTDANVQLAYLTGANADDLRAEILRRASGIRQQAAEDAVAAARVAAGVDPEADRTTLSDLARQRIAEFTAPELDPNLAPPESVVKMLPSRLIGSTLLNSGTIFLVIAVVVICLLPVFTDAGPELLFTLIPIVFGLGSYVISRVTRSLRYSIAATPDGVRVGFGLLSTSNETLPPGRIHAIDISQDLLWRPFDWWTVRVNVASQSTAKAVAGQQNTTILPVGSREDVMRVLELVLPDVVTEESRALVAAGFAPATPDDGFTTTPKRAAVLRWFSWRRNGFLLHPDAVILRRGAIWRQLTIMPTARLQSVSIHQGPLLRALRAAAVHFHTVTGPVTAAIGAIDAGDATALFRDAADASAAAIRRDRTHRWGAA